MIRITLLALVAFLIPSMALAATIWPVGGIDGDAVRTVTIPQNALVNDFTTPINGCPVMSVTETYLGVGSVISLYATDVDSTPTSTEIEADVLLDQLSTSDLTHLAFVPQRQEIRFVVDTVSTDGDSIFEISCGNFNAVREAAASVTQGLAAAAEPGFTHQFSLMVKDPVTADIWGLFRAPADLTISAIDCIVEGTSAVMSVVEGTATSMSGAGIDGATTILCDTNGQADDGTLSNPTVDAGDWVSLLFGAETATQITTTITYTFD